MTLWTDPRACLERHRSRACLERHRSRACPKLEWYLSLGAPVHLFSMRGRTHTSGVRARARRRRHTIATPCTLASLMLFPPFARIGGGQGGSHCGRVDQPAASARAPRQSRSHDRDGRVSRVHGRQRPDEGVHVHAVVQTRRGSGGAVPQPVEGRRQGSCRQGSCRA